MLAISKGVLTTVKDAAKGTLNSGWSLLLPTTEERAKTLSELLAEKLGKSDSHFSFYMQCSVTVVVVVHISDNLL